MPTPKARGVKPNPYPSDSHNTGTPINLPPMSLLRRLPSLTRLIGGLSLMATGGLVIAGIFVGVGVWRTGDRFISSLTSIFTAPQPEPKVDVQSIVLSQIQGASELTTAVFAMQAVVPASRDRTIGNYVIGKTTLLYIAYGEVRAGVDLAKVQPTDVEVVDDSIRIRLPAPEILDSKIDVNRSSVYDYDRGFLGLGPDSAPELQSLAQRETLKQIEQTACDQGLLLEANDRAKAAITQLLDTAGYTHLAIETQPPTASSCGAATPSAPSSSVELPLPPTASPY